MIQAEHWGCWFRKHAATIPVQYLPSAFVGAVRNTAFAPGSDEEKMQAIREIIEVFDEVTDRKEREDEKSGKQG